MVNRVAAAVRIYSMAVPVKTSAMAVPVVIAVSASKQRPRARRDALVAGMKRSLAAVACVVVVLAAGCGDFVSENNPAHGEIRFTNDTDVPISMVLTLGGPDAPLSEWFDRAPYLTQTHEPGTEFLHGVVYQGSNVSWVDEERTRYCQPNTRYWFVTPADSTYRPTGGYDNDKTWTADDVIVVTTLDGPCWDERDSYVITTN